MSIKEVPEEKSDVPSEKKGETRKKSTVKIPVFGYFVVFLVATLLILWIAPDESGRTLALFALIISGLLAIIAIIEQKK